MWPTWYTPPSLYRARVADILTYAATLSGIPKADIVGKSRLGHLMPVRFAVYRIAFEHGHSYPAIGRMVGGRDHSTVIHGARKAAYQESRDQNYAKFIRGLRVAAGIGSAKVAPQVIPVARVPHVKKIMLAEGEVPDNGHRFHDGIAKGSAALLKALAA